jgi:hypothetical protein
MGGFPAEEGFISPQDDPLFPKFYLAKGLEDRLPETLNNGVTKRPHWLIQD